MTITYVGSATAVGTNASFNISLSGLGLQEGDLVIVATGQVGNSDTNPGVSTSGYTEAADLFSDGTFRTNLSVSWKIMGSTPDSTVACNGSTSPLFGSAGIAYALRGVDQATPLDVTRTTAVGSGAAAPNPPSITPTTSDAWVVIVGGQSASAPDSTVTEPSGYTNAVSRTGDPSNGITIAMASKAWTSGAEDPGVWTNWSTTVNDTWAAVTLAIRPAVTAGQPASIRTSQIPFGASGRVGMFGGRW